MVLRPRSTAAAAPLKQDSGLRVEQGASPLELRENADTVESPERLNPLHIRRPCPKRALKEPRTSLEIVLPL